MNWTPQNVERVGLAAQQLFGTQSDRERASGRVADLADQDRQIAINEQQRAQESDRQGKLLQQQMRMKILESQLELTHAAPDDATRTAAEGNVKKLMQASGISQDDLMFAAAGKSVDPNTSLATWLNIGKNATQESANAFRESVKSGKPDPTLLQPKSTTKNVSLAPQAQLVNGEDGTVLAENPNVRPVAERVITLPPQGQAFDPSGKMIAENTNVIARNTNASGSGRTTDQERRRSLVGPEVKAAKEAFDKDNGSLQNAARYALALNDERTANSLQSPALGGKKRSETEQSITALKNFDDGTNRITTILEKAPTAGLLAGNGARVASGFIANAKSLTGSLGIGVEDGALDQKKFDDQLSKMAGANAGLKSAIFGVAVQFAIGSGIAKGRFSNDDMRLALENIGGKGTVTIPMLVSRLKEARAGIANNVLNTLSTERGNFQTNEPDFSTLTGNPADAPASSGPRMYDKTGKRIQ